MPVSSVGFPSGIVLLNYISIRFNMTPLLAIFILVLDGILHIGFILEFNNLVNLLKIPMQTLKERMILSQRKLNKLELKGLPPIRINIGSVHHLNEDTRVTLIRMIPEKTVDLLITF